MNKKRERHEIIHDILQVIKEKEGKIKPTHIMYQSNLSQQSLFEYLTQLKNGGLITENILENHKTYFLTEKGKAFLDRYKSIRKFIDSFGLG